MSDLKKFNLRALLVYGRIGSGKTMFALTCPYKPILYLDGEYSSAPYRPLFQEGITFVDVREKFKTADAFEAALKGIQPGKYTTMRVLRKPEAMCSCMALV